MLRPLAPDPLKTLLPAWGALPLGLALLALAWWQAVPGMGTAALGVALGLALLAALSWVLLLLLQLWRWQRHPLALAQDLRHPVRHADAALVPAGALALALLAALLAGRTPWALALWWLGQGAQVGVAAWLMGRWLHPAKAQALPWAAVTPALLWTVCGHALAALGGLVLGQGALAAAHAGAGLLLWQVLLTQTLVRLAVHGPWAERLLPLWWVNVAPPALLGLAAVQAGAPLALGWMGWGAAGLALLWVGQAGRRMVSQPFAVGFWALAAPLAALAALGLRLAQDAGGGFAALAVIVLALATLVQAALLLGTFKGLRDGSLLKPEPVALLSVAGGGEG